MLLVAPLGALLCSGCIKPAAPKSKLPFLVVLAPVNFDLKTPAQLEAGMDPMSSLIGRFLEHNGAEVIRVSREDVYGAMLEGLAGEKVPSLDSPEYAALMSGVLEKLSPSS